MKRRWKILIVVAVLLGMGMLLAMLRHYQLRWATDAYIAQLKAEGEPLDLAQVLPPSVPPEQNSADTFRRAAALMKTNEDWWATNYVGAMTMIAPGKAMVLWQQPDIRWGGFTDSWEVIDAAIAKDKEALTLLQQIISKPDFDFQANYDAGIMDLSISNFFLAESKQAAQRLSAAAVYDLHHGDTATAVENLRAMLAISKAMRDERLIIAELVRIAIAQMAVALNWEILQSTNLTDDQLTQLQQDWTDLDFIQSSENAMEMERVCGEITMGKWRSSNAKLQKYLDLRKEEWALTDKEAFWDSLEAKPKAYLWRYWWSYPDELCSFKAYQGFINALRSAQTNGSFQDAGHYPDLNPARSRDSSTGDESNYHWLYSQDIGFLSAVGRRVMLVEVSKRTVITAIALKRYQLKHGNYPPDLKTLVPEFVAAVPLDPVDGQPLRYRLKADGTFLLYSVGPNGKDDGGNPSLEKFVESSSYYWLNPHALDWVWPQPATPEEIKKFYARPQN